MNYQREFIIAKNYLRTGHYDKVVEIINQLLEKYGNDPQLLFDMSLLLAGTGDYRSALKELNLSFELEKSYEKLEVLAELNMAIYNFSEAAIQYEELIKYKKEEKYYDNCVLAYTNLGFDEEAIRIGEMMVKDLPSEPDPYSKLAFLYMSAGMEKEAIECCETMEKLFHNHPSTYNLFGLLNETIYNDYEKAKTYYQKAAKLGFADAFYNLGVCCKQSEDFENAEKYLKKMIAMHPDTTMDYNFTLGSIYFALKKLRLGYKYYQNRRSVKKIKETNRFKLWDGKNYPKETLYIAAEQGFGDNINFVRYIPLTVKKFKKIYYSTRPELLELIKRSLPQEKYPNLEIITNKDSVKYDKFLPIMDLPFVLHQTFHNIPAKESYLVDDKRKTEMYKKNFFSNDSCKIGLCWRAKGMDIRDLVYRTIDAPYYFKDIMDLDNVQYYSFQTNDIFDMCEKYPQIKDLSPMFDSFDETASMIKNLDILITVDTAIAHLAGALGVKTYLLLCHAPDWRWFDNTEKTEWYPSVTIIKQQDRRTWEDVSKKLTKYIKADVKKFSKSK